MKKLIAVYRSMNIAARASLWFVVCNLLQKGISTITVPLFTRLLTTAEYGTYNLYLTWFNTLTIVTSLNLYYGVFNNAMNRLREGSERDRYISSMQGVTVTLTLLLVVIYLPFQGFWSDLLGLSRLMLWLMLAELLVEPALHFWQGRQRFAYRYKAMVGVTLLKSTLNPVLGLVLVCLARSHKATARVVSVVAVEVLIAGTLLAIQFYRGRVYYHRENWRYALGFNIPLLPHYLSGSILNQGDRIMIQKLNGEAEVGIYSLAYSVGMLIQLFTNAINQSMTPWMYENLNNQTYENIRKNVTSILLFLAGAIGCLLFFVPEIVSVFGSPAYRDAMYVVPPVACSVYFIFLYNVFAIPELYYERQKFMSVASVLAAVLNIALNTVCIPVFGYVAAGYTTLFCYIVYSVGHYAVSRRICREKIGAVSVFDVRRILGISVAVFAGSIVFPLLYPITVLRVVLALVALLPVVANYKRIFRILTEMRGK